MEAWCLAHPYLTTLIVVFGMSTFMSVVNNFLNLFKKAQPTIVNMKVDSPGIAKTVPRPLSPNVN